MRQEKSLVWLEKGVVIKKVGKEDLHTFIKIKEPFLSKMLIMKSAQVQKSKKDLTKVLVIGPSSVSSDSQKKHAAHVPWLWDYWPTQVEVISS